MCRGKAKVNYLGRSGVVMPQTVPSWDFIYETSTIKHPKYTIGDRVVLPDGREYRYGKSSGVCYAGQGCEFTYTGYSAYAAADVAQAIGDKQVSISAAAIHAVIAKDALRGGYVVMHNQTIADNAQVQVRGIIGNDVVTVADSGCVLYLDGALTVAVVVGTTGIEVFENPYAALVLSTGSTAVAGVPATYISAANIYFWVQIKGPCFIAPQTNVTGPEIGCMWRHDGTVTAAATAVTGSVEALCTSQYAGHTLIGNQTGNGPLFMLQG